jgi:hypothetical protein
VGFEGKICGVSILRAGEVNVIPIIFAAVTLTLGGKRVGYGGRPQRGLQERQDWQNPNPTSMRNLFFQSSQRGEPNWHVGRRNGSTKALLLQGSFRVRVARADPNVFSTQFPPDIANRYVLLLDPMLGVLEIPGPYLHFLSHVLSATGGSAIKAVEVLKENGVPEERIIFINLVSELPLRLETFRLDGPC